jgi:hypothetical protein
MEVNLLSAVQSSYVISSKKDTKAVEDTELSETEKLEAFKKEIWDEINSMPWCSSINWSIQITDSAFERMMEEPEFKEKIMSVLAEDAAVGRYPMSNAMITVDENGYSGYSYNFRYGEEAFEAHSNDKDSFYTKKATKKIDYEELWEEQQLKRERQERLDKEYFDSLVEKRRYNLKQTVAKFYEKGTVVS